MAGAMADADVIVIGGGIAGLVAANRLGQLGRRVIVLERGTDQHYPCNARWSGGTFHVHFTDPMAPKEVLRAAIDRATEGFTTPELGDALAEDCGRLITWLKGEGIRMVSLGGYHTAILAPPSGTAPGLAWKGQGGDVALQQMEASLVRRGGRIVRGARANAIVPTDGGMRVDVDGEVWPQGFLARDVIIADGGFPANIDLVRQHVTPHAEKLLQRNAGSATGDGLRMAQALGAALTGGLDCFYGHLLSRDALQNPRLWPRPYLDALVTAGIVVDGSGARFADEGNGGVYMANAVARLDDPLCASVVFDHDIWTGPGAKSLVAANPHLVDGGGTLHRADTIEDLARLMGVSAQRLSETVGAYNAALEASSAAALQPPRRADRYQPRPIRTAPFYGVPVCSGITHVMGGIAVNSASQVLRDDGSVIDNLYAAGTCTGGIEGGPAIGYVGGLSKSGVMGLRAAEHIAGAAAEVPGPPSASVAAEPAGRPADEFPTLRLVVRHGMAASAGLALAMLLAAIVISWALGSVWIGLAGLALTGIVYVLARILVELVRLITQMLMP